MPFPVSYETPPNYEAFAYVKEMPKLNTGALEVADYFAKVGVFWIQYADGAFIYLSIFCNTFFFIP